MSMNYPLASPVPGSSPATPSPVTWYVLSQTEVVQPGPQGTLVSGHKIVFGTSDGHTGSVFVPDSSYTLDNVRQAIQDKVTLVTSIGALNGSNSPV